MLIFHIFPTVFMEPIIVFGLDDFDEKLVFEILVRITKFGDELSGIFVFLF